MNASKPNTRAHAYRNGPRSHPRMCLTQVGMALVNRLAVFSGCMSLSATQLVPCSLQQHSERTCLQTPPSTAALAMLGSTLKTSNVCPRYAAWLCTAHHAAATATRTRPSPAPSGLCWRNVEDEPAQHVGVLAAGPRVISAPRLARSGARLRVGPRLQPAAAHEAAHIIAARHNRAELRVACAAQRSRYSGDPAMMRWHYQE
jgi:hypothetical protein